MLKGQHKERRGIKGSSVIIFAMYALWIGYICAQVLTYANYHSWIPSEMTYATAACFIVETVALARIRLAKEGYILPKRKQNQFLQRLGVAEEAELEEVAQEISEQNKEAQNG